MIIIAQKRVLSLARLWSEPPSTPSVKVAARDDADFAELHLYSVSGFLSDAEAASLRELGSSASRATTRLQHGAPERAAAERQPALPLLLALEARASRLTGLPYHAGENSLQVTEQLPTPHALSLKNVHHDKTRSHRAWQRFSST